jgi:hypothetical protein
VPALPPAAPGARKLELLLSELERGLRDEIFLFQRRDLAALLELAPLQGATLSAVCRLARELDVRPDSDVAQRVRAVADARREILAEIQDSLAAMNAELASMRRAEARLRQIRQSAALSLGERENRLNVEG